MSRYELAAVRHRVRAGRRGRRP